MAVAYWLKYHHNSIPSNILKQVHLKIKLKNIALRQLRKSCIIYQHLETNFKRFRKQTYILRFYSNTHANKCAKAYVSCKRDLK